jgi:hypothetical protein
LKQYYKYYLADILDRISANTNPKHKTRANKTNVKKKRSITEDTKKKPSQRCKSMSTKTYSKNSG